MDYSIYLVCSRLFYSDTCVKWYECDGYDSMKIVERQMLQDCMPCFTAHIHCEMNVFPLIFEICIQSKKHQVKCVPSCL